MEMPVTIYIPKSTKAFMIEKLKVNFWAIKDMFFFCVQTIKQPFDCMDLNIKIIQYYAVV